MNKAYYIDPETGETLDWDAGMDLLERRIRPSTIVTFPPYHRVAASRHV